MTKKPTSKIGFIARRDFGGLAVESWEFIEHVKPHKILAIDIGPMPVDENRFRADYVSKGEPDDNLCRKFLEGLDVLFAIETPYNWHMIKIAREMGVKTVLRVNYEWLPDQLPEMPDILVAPSLWHWEDIPGNKVYLPFPVNRERLPYQKRTVAKKFLHVAGNLRAAWDRNGTQTVIDAMQYVGSDVEMIIKSQVPVDFKLNKKITWKVENVQNYWEVWEDADVFVLPRRYAGQSL